MDATWFPERRRAVRAEAEQSENRASLADLRARSAEEVFEEHLRLRVTGNLEEDLRRNYAEDVVLLTVNSNARGHDALRMSARRLRDQLPDARYEFLAKQVNGPYVLLIWRGLSSRFNATEGADSFVIRDGKIRFQSIHYRLEATRAPSLPAS
jgi:hypothetical protein